MIILKALLAGIICGAVFHIIKLPIPAPPTIVGIAGIVGIFIGYMLVKWAQNH